MIFISLTGYPETHRNIDTFVELNEYRLEENIALNAGADYVGLILNLKTSWQTFSLLRNPSPLKLHMFP